MKPCGNFPISVLKRFRQAQVSPWGARRENGVYHKKAKEVYRESIATQLDGLSPMWDRAKMAIDRGHLEGAPCANLRQSKYSLLK